MGSPARHFSHCDLNSSGIASSQPTPSRHSCCRIRFPTKMNGVTRPRGSNTELTVDKIPLLDRGLSCRMILNWSFSDSMHQCTPRARSMVAPSLIRWWSVRSVARSSCETELNTTSLLLEVNFCSRKPPL